MLHCQGCHYNNNLRHPPESRPTKMFNTRASNVLTDNKGAPPVCHPPWSPMMRSSDDSKLGQLQPPVIVNARHRGVPCHCNHHHRRTTSQTPLPLRPPLTLNGTTIMTPLHHTPPMTMGWCDGHRLGKPLPTPCWSTPAVYPPTHW